MRTFGRYTCGLLLIFSFLSFVFLWLFDKPVQPYVWWALVVGLLLLVALYRGTPEVLRSLKAPAGRAASAFGHSAGKAGSSVMNKASENVYATVVILIGCAAVGAFGIAIYTENMKWWEAGSLLTLLFVLLGIGYFQSSDHFLANWSAYWLGLSLYGFVHSIAFGHPWVVAFAVSSVLALLTLVGAWGKILQFLGEVLSFERGNVVGFAGWWGIMALVGLGMTFGGPLQERFQLGLFTLTRGDAATILIAIAIGCFALVLFSGGQKLVEKFAK